MMNENLTLEAAEKIARSISAAVTNLQEAIDAAHDAGLSIDLELERIGDCQGPRTRPLLIISVNYPLTTRYRLSRFFSRDKQLLNINYPLAGPPAAPTDEGNP
jgi:hypothetical protein